MSQPGSKIREFRLRLKSNFDATMKQLAWNILAHARQLTYERELSKGTLLAGWVIGVGSINTWHAPYKYEPYSWYAGNDIHARYAGWVRQSYTSAMTVTFNVPFAVTNSTRYLFEDVNLNPELGGTNDVALDAEYYQRALSTFAKAEIKRLFGNMDLTRQYSQQIIV